MLLEVANAKSALDLLLWSDVAVVATLSLSAIGCFDWKLHVTLSANHFLSLVLSGKSSESWLNLNLTHTTSSESQDQVESGLLLDVVVREGSAIFELLSSEDQSLLVGWNTFFILDLSPNTQYKTLEVLT